MLPLGMVLGMVMGVNDMSTLREQIANDIDTIFFKNAEEFSDELKIGLDSKRTFTVYGSMQVNTVENNAGNQAPLQKVSYVLYVPYPIGGSDGIELNCDDVLYIDGVAYKVVDIHDELGVATIYLTRGSDRRRFFG